MNITAKRTPTRRLPIRGVVAVVIAVAAMRLLSGAAAHGQIVITGVAANHSSVRISFEPVSGAKDYRVYDVSNPREVKYGGLRQTKSREPIPSTEIEWNVVGGGEPKTLIVEAVDQLGPVPQGSLYDPDTNMPLFHDGTHQAMLGGNKGPTLDGRISTNGQGPYTNVPQAIAESRPFTVSANPVYRAIPSVAQATSQYFDTFNNADGQTLKLVARDPNAMTMQYVLNAGTTRGASITYLKADVLNSMPFITADHFMDVLFDGGTPGTNNPLHKSRAVMAFSPDLTADWRSGEVLHVTQEVDAHVNDRRWIEISITPAADPLTAFDPITARLNGSNRALTLAFAGGDGCTLDLFRGSSDREEVTAKVGTRLWGAAGQALNLCDGLGIDDTGFDLRARLDLFLSQQRAALFANGKLILQSAIPAGALPWAPQPVKIYYTHYVYHTDNDISGMRRYACTPLNAFWFNDPLRGTSDRDNACGIRYPSGFGFPRSDERHWDNLGFEVLPRTIAPPDNFAALRKLVQPPPIKAATF